MSVLVELFVPRICIFSASKGRGHLAAAGYLKPQQQAQCILGMNPRRQLYALLY